MQSVSLLKGLRNGGGHVLCLGAHSDDIEIGCAALIQQVTEGAEGLSVDWVVLSADGPREAEARASAAMLLSKVQDREVIVKKFRNGFFPFYGAEIKEYFESLKSRRSPSLILTHHRNDLHQDHRLVAELTWNTFRDHLILEYEIPKFDGDLGSPNVFVPLTRRQLEKKVDVLVRHFESQRDKQWFSPDTFAGLCRIRGVECNSPTGFAEAFYARKLLLA